MAVVGGEPRSSERARSRIMLSIVLLSASVIAGGLFVQRGLGTVGQANGEVTPLRLYEQVAAHVQRDFVDSLSDSAIYGRTAAGVVAELHDAHSVYLTADRLRRLSESTSGRYAGVGAE